MQPYDSEKMEKLPESCRFFDINGLWYFPNSWVVRWLYDKPISANQITALSLLFGFISAGLYVSSYSHSLAFGSAFLYGKLFLDNVDGPLARVRGETSRLGRFFDSFVDFSVNIAVYTALACYLVRQTGRADWWTIGFIALLSSFIHCSLFVYYLVQYTVRAGTYDKNRVRETVTEEDQVAREEGALPVSVFLMQNFHQWVYDWQDALVERLDNICKRIVGIEENNLWYSDKMFLVLAGPLCLCTNNMVLIFFSMLDQLELCFLLVVVGGNFYMVVIIVWKVLRFRKLRHERVSSNFSQSWGQAGP